VLNPGPFRGRKPRHLPRQKPRLRTHARVGNPRPKTIHPPSPPEGGSGTGQLLVEEAYVTERGRRRRRLVAVDLAEVRERLREAGKEDLAAWDQVSAFLRDAVGESTFGIWLAPLELIAVDVEGTPIVSAPTETVGWVARRFGWVARRFGRILDGAAQRAGCGLRIADGVERKAAEALAPAASPPARAAPVGSSADARISRHVSPDGCAVEVQPDLPGDVPSDRPCTSRDGQSARQPTYTSAYPSSYTDVYTQTKEVSW
jgi:hypothetical protein